MCVFWRSLQGCLGWYSHGSACQLSDSAHRWVALFQKNFQAEFVISAHSEYERPSFWGGAEVNQTSNNNNTFFWSLQ